MAPGEGGGGTISAVSTAVVSVGAVQECLRITGTVTAENSATLLAPRILGSRSDFNRGGRGGGGGAGHDFELILLDLAAGGTVVKAGDVVGQFDVESQLQRLEDYRDAVTQLENSIRKVEANLAATREGREQSARTAKADWEKAILDLRTAPVRSQIDADKFRLATEENALSYQEQLKQVAAFEESQRASLRSAKFNLDQSRIELQRAENNIARMTIRAPIAGMVVIANVVQNNEIRQVRQGDEIHAGQPFLSIVDPSSMVLKAKVNQVDADRLRLGMKAFVALDAYPEYRGTGTLVGIGAMSITSTFRATYVGEIPVRLKIEKSDPRLLPDLTASAEVVLRVEPNTTVAPRAAIFSDEGGPFVYLKQPDGWKHQDVEIGLSNSIDIAVRSGVRPGDVLALDRTL